MKLAKKHIKEFFKHINIKRFKLMTFTFCLLLIMIITIFLTPTTISKYTSQSTSNADVDVAFYLLKTSYQSTNVLLDKITPRNEPYIYTFSISNNNGVNRTETKLEYDLSIRTTTNLPLTYSLYMNQNYNNQNASNIITNQQVIQDDDGTYFNKIETNTNYFSYEYDETNTYQLLVSFPSTYVDEMYQDIIESIEITINSKQIIDN